MKLKRRVFIDVGRYLKSANNVYWGREQAKVVSARIHSENSRK